jgi:3D-(3,5/4)-trihydroxycyclohexane-1,2-dione acylhydrolase (decyclizing)
MMQTVRLTAAQALVRFLAAQMTEIDGVKLSIFAGVWAIFGHGNVAAIGEALYAERERLPTYRGNNEQGMALAAIAFAKASRRRRMMVCTSSIGPGATNMVTAAAVAHVNRLPVLFVPGDVFATRIPDPVLQQVESFGDGTVSANDCFRPVSRYFDRITRPEQLIPALNRTMAVLTDPAECGPVTLAFCQDVQAEAFDYPESFFAERVWRQRRVRPDEGELAAAVAALRAATKPIIVAGGGVLYSEAMDALRAFAEAHDIPVAETQSGKSSMRASHKLAVGSIGVTGTSAANALAEEADVILAVGTRLQDFTTGSWDLFRNPDRRIIGLNTQPFDAHKHRALPLVADARAGLEDLSAELAGWRTPASWQQKIASGRTAWAEAAARATGPTNTVPPSDAQVIGAVQRHATADTVVVNASGGLPGELHKHWMAERPSGYHMEYGYSCMGYEIAGGIGVKLAMPDRDVVVMVGDGSYLMMNSELATSVLLGQKLTVVVLDNRGFGCITRLQQATGGARFNNLFEDTNHAMLPAIDFRAHAEALGAIAEHVVTVDELEAALERAKGNDRTTVIVIDTDPFVITEAGGHWWDVVVPEVSTRPQVNAARTAYEQARGSRRLGD